MEGGPGTRRALQGAVPRLSLWTKGLLHCWLLGHLSAQAHRGHLPLQGQEKSEDAGTGMASLTGLRLVAAAPVSWGQRYRHPLLLAWWTRQSMPLLCILAEVQVGLSWSQGSVSLSIIWR